ncbi:hypothetical protein KP509_16G053500 [Ceratopteris richardii]|uniref:RING-type E3 ubiquitin transferase n=1 Tax=Ceratopteris richardii TaxID=49495 RepID=A0A8T2T2J3_CERRI|nr:hypothetical protein KP509_16G053500 [Ceratopteris richardii]
MERARASTTSGDMSPLLNHDASIPHRNPLNIRCGLWSLARFLRQTSSRRMMREPSMMVREAAAEQIEERQSDWVHSKPVVVLDLIWNLSFVMVAAATLALSKQEKPSTPLRLWFCGYCLQCLLHIVCVCFQYKRRDRQYRQSHDSYSKWLEFALSMFSFAWWVLGVYWITAGGQSLLQEAPKLYWLCTIFLGIDVIFLVFCAVLACIAGIAVCCCLPCIIGMLYAMADQIHKCHTELKYSPSATLRSLKSHMLFDYPRTIDLRTLSYQKSIVAIRLSLKKVILLVFIV